MNEHMKQLRLGWVLTIITLFYLPVLCVIFQSFIVKETWRQWGAFLASPLFLRTLIFTLGQALLSAVASLVVAFPGAYFLGKYDFPGKSLIRSLMVLPFVLPGILVVLGFIVFYGQNGMLNSLFKVLHLPFRFSGLYGWAGIILAHVFYNFPLCVRMIGESWERIDPAFLEAADVLGSRRWDRLGRVTMPLLAPSIMYSFLMAFVYSYLSFTVVLVLGGYLYRTFEVLIYVTLNHKMDLNSTQMIAMTQLILLSGIMVVIRRFGNQLLTTSPFRSGLRRLTWKGSPWTVVGLFCYLLLVAVVFGGPLVAVFVRSILHLGIEGAGLTIQNYTALFQPSFLYLAGKDFLAVFATSIGLAVGTGFTCLLLAYLSARSLKAKAEDRQDELAQMPLGISLLTFSFGLYILVGRVLPPIVLVFWAQIFMGFPLVYSLLRLARRELGDELLEAAAVLGANARWRWLGVEWPLLRPALGTGFAYAAAFSLGDLTTVLFLGEGNIVTLPMALYRLIGQYRFTQGLALGVIYIVSVLGLFLMIELLTRLRRLRAGRGGLDHA
jgi:thiamine transport system permease protein